MSEGATRRKALVLGWDTRAFLAVIRSLGRGGVEVHIGWHEYNRISVRSRYVSKVHDLPSPTESVPTWKSAIVELIRRERFDLILPCTDSTLAPFQQNRAQLEPHGRIYLLGDEAYSVLSDKIKTNELARRVGVRVPREVVLTASPGSEEVLGEFGLPVVLKPHTSYDPERPETCRKVRKAYTSREFEEFSAEMLRGGPVAVQENFKGFGVGVELLLKDGEPLLTFQHVRLHEPLHGGGSSYRMSVPVQPELLDASLRLLRPLSYTGVVMVEFKVDPWTGEWVLIEVNGRFWGSLPLAVAAGADLPPLALFQLLVEGRTEFPQGYRNGLCCRNWQADLGWQAANLRTDRSDPTLATRPLPAVFWETIKNLALLRERSDTLTSDDPAPGLAEVGAIGRAFLSKAARRLLAAYYNLSPVRRSLGRRARADLRRAKTILFVCKGNVCRSPFAEHLARRLLLGGGCRSFRLASCPAPVGRRRSTLWPRRRPGGSTCRATARGCSTRP